MDVDVVVATVAGRNAACWLSTWSALAPDLAPVWHRRATARRTLTHGSRTDAVVEGVGMSALLELSHVTKVFTTQDAVVTAVAAVSLVIRAGEFVCLLGHAGCGKSTLLGLLAGTEEPTEGDVLVRTAPGEERALARVLVPTSPNLLPWMTARQSMRLAVDRVGGDESREERAERVERYLDLLGIGDVADQHPAALSPPNLQSVALARAMALSPDVLLLDDPFSRLPPSARSDLQDLLAQVWDEEPGRSVVMATADVDEALYLADRVVLLRDGPASCVHAVFDVPFSRPRTRAGVLAHPRYPASRRRLRELLAQCARQDQAGPDPGVAQAS